MPKLLIAYSVILADLDHVQVLAPDVFGIGDRLAATAAWNDGALSEQHRHELALAEQLALHAARPALISPVSGSTPHNPQAQASTSFLDFWKSLLPIARIDCDRAVQIVTVFSCTTIS